MPRRPARRRVSATAAAVVAALLLGGPLPARAAPTPDAAAVALVGDGARVLFVGNSFTQGYDEPVFSFGKNTVRDINRSGLGGVPGIVTRLADDLGVTLDVSVEAAGGRSLRWHLDNRGSALDDRWDLVVAQEYSLQALPTARGGAPEQFRSAAREAHARILTSSPHARTVLFQTWASPTSARLQGYGTGAAALRAMQNDLDAVYAAEAADRGWTRTAPVGEAFLRAVDEGIVDATPEDGLDAGTVRLWNATDHRHAAAAGSYLAAAVLTATLTHRNPQLLAVGEGSAAAALGLGPETGETLHRIAADVVAVPLAVDARVRTLCRGDAPVAHVLVRNLDDVSVDVRVAGGRGIRDFPLRAGAATVVEVPAGPEGRMPRRLGVTATSGPDAAQSVLTVPGPRCVTGP